MIQSIFDYVIEIFTLEKYCTPWQQEVEIHDDDAEKYVEPSEQTGEDRGQEMEIHDDDAEKSMEPSEQNGEDRVVAHEAAAALESEPNTPVGGWSEEGYGDEDEEDSEKLNVSIGKKLWTFFTTWSCYFSSINPKMSSLHVGSYYVSA